MAVRPWLLRRSWLVSIMLVGGLAVAACTDAPAPNASGRPDNTAMVLAEPNEPPSLNPLAGYAPHGAAKIFDGLVEHQADGTLRPDLATALPVPDEGGRSWTITLRTDVRFSDGTPFGPADVLATYRALLDPAFAAPLRADYDMFTGVEQIGPNRVRFDLAYPYAPFPDKLVLGILSAAELATPRPVTLPAASEPIGTGPYTLLSWSHGQQLVLAANPRYPAALGGPPKVKKVTVRFRTDDVDRARLLRAGQLDGAALSPAQAASFAHDDAFTVLTDRSADLRSVRMPAHGPVTGDPAIRLALNEAVDRTAPHGGPLDGAGTPAVTPMPTVLPEYVEPAAKFTHDLNQARAGLLAAGWVASADGGRSKAGVPAAFTLDYPAGDAVDAALATSFVTAARSVGVKVTPVAVPPARLATVPATDATLTSTGDPFDPDLGLFRLLANGNDAGYADAAVDAALQEGRRHLDPAARAVSYRQFQRAYVADPAMVCLLFVDHTYVMRANWTGYTPVTDGTGQGLTWGPWWNLGQWAPR